MTSHADTLKTATAPFARTVVAVAGTVALRIREAFLALKHRHDATILASLDDRMLADIGLTRSDLRQAFDEPLWRDPTARLVSVVGERRGARRSAFRASRLAFTAPPIAPETNSA